MRTFFSIPGKRRSVFSGSPSSRLTLDISPSKEGVLITVEETPPRTTSRRDPIYERRRAVEESVPRKSMFSLRISPVSEKGLLADLLNTTRVLKEASSENFSSAVSSVTMALNLLGIRASGIGLNLFDAGSKKGNAVTESLVEKALSKPIDSMERNLYMEAAAELVREGAYYHRTHSVYADLSETDAPAAAAMEKAMRDSGFMFGKPEMKIPKEKESSLTERLVALLSEERHSEAKELLASLSPSERTETAENALVVSMMESLDGKAASERKKAVKSLAATLPDTSLRFAASVAMETLAGDISLENAKRAVAELLGLPRATADEIETEVRGVIEKMVFVS